MRTADRFSRTRAPGQSGQDREKASAAGRPLTRRELAACVAPAALAGVAAAQTAAESPAGELRRAQAETADAARQLAAYEVPIATEPATVFRA
jgi:hypothetical protein